MQSSLSRRELVLAVAAVVASLALLVVYFIWAPITNDGAWYAYPAYAMHMGGDPSENLPDVALPAADSARVVAKFGWENRSSLVVPVLARWFDVFGAGWIQLKVFGLLTLLLLVLCAAVQHAKGCRWAAGT